MIGEKFEILVTPFRNNAKPHRLKVEIVYETDQIVRYKVFAGIKEMVLEKILMRKSNQWKIQKTNFQMDGNPKEIAMNLMRIQDTIDWYRTQRG